MTFTDDDLKLWKEDMDAWDRKHSGLLLPPFVEIPRVTFKAFLTRLEAAETALQFADSCFLNNYPADPQSKLQRDEWEERYEVWRTIAGREHR